MFLAAANFDNRDDYGTLILDRMGSIVSCGEPAGQIFGISHVRMVGRYIQDFVEGLFLGVTSPGFNERFIAYLCTQDKWRELDAKDARNHRFPVEVNLSKIVAEHRELLLLNVRRPHDDPRPPSATAGCNTNSTCPAPVLFEGDFCYSLPAGGLPAQPRTLQEKKMKTSTVKSKSNGSKKPASAASSPDAPLNNFDCPREQMIAEAAYFRAAQRGFAPGNEMSDWLQAEADIEAVRDSAQ